MSFLSLVSLNESVKFGNPEPRDQHPQTFNRTSSKFPSGIFRVQIEELSKASQIVEQLQKFKHFFLKREYQFYDSRPLLANDPTILLMNSTVAVFKDEMMQDHRLGKRAISQFCFRAKEVEDYAYCFNMLGISADIAYLEAAYRDMVDFLIEESGISRADLHIVLNSKDELLVNCTKALFKDNQIHYLDDDNEKYNVKWKFGHEKLKGNGLTIVGKIGKGEDSDILNSQFVPLGNVILVDNGYGQRYVDVGFGVECILSYFYGGNIFSIPFYLEQINCLNEISDFSDYSKKLLKLLVGFVSLYSEAILPGNKGESYVATKIQNQLFALLTKSNKNLEVFDLILAKISSFYSKEEQTIFHEACSLLKSNLRKQQSYFQSQLAKVQKMAIRLYQTGANEQLIIKNLRETFGFPEETIKEVTMHVSGYSTSGQPLVIQHSNEISTKWSKIDCSNVQSVRFRQGTIKADQIAKNFIKFFVDMGEPSDHKIIKGASVLPKNDPTLLFINSGMAAIKPYFTGETPPPYPRLCNVQPCIRTNDIDDIGDMHHLSFFHMLGSWSIGNYYKKEAVNFAYDLLINVLGFPKEKLYFTVFSGDEKLKIEPDEETANHWRSLGVAEDHLVYLPAEDNLWGPAGDTGPCGPCTEIFYDMGDSFAPAYVPGRGETFDTKRRYVEIWNGGVFMQYFMYKDKSIEPLKFKSVDTGSGLERMTMTMNGYDSVYETDLLKPIYDLVRAHVPSISTQTTRMMTDHIRTAVYLISEGVKPGNSGQEYIVRKLIRKCVAALIKANQEADVIKKIVPETVEFLKSDYLHFTGNEAAIQAIFYAEVEQCRDVVRKGVLAIEKHKPKEGKDFSPQIAHDLVTAKGLPLEILQQCLLASQLNLDMQAYNKLEEEHRQISKNAKKETIEEKLSFEILEIINKTEKTKFTGYEKDKEVSTIQLLIQNGTLVKEINNNQPFLFAVPTTPFYAEGGGQCGDKGLAEFAGKATVQVMDVKSIDGVYLHRAMLTEGTIRQGEQVALEVNPDHRAAVKRNHSATHLLHYALCQVIGATALQQGSVVEASKLRFDFKCGYALGDDKIKEIEKIVSECIAQNHAIQTTISSYEDAKKAGAIGMFGEKYGNVVRVVKMGPSMELCGGTHASNTGDLGQFIIATEKSIAKGIRRITAHTGPEALQLAQSRMEALNKGAHLLSGQEAKVKKGELSSSLVANELKKIEVDFGKNFVVLEFATNQEQKALSEFSTQYFSKDTSCIGLLMAFNTKKGKTLTCMARKMDQDQINAEKLIALLMDKCDGKGGGNALLAKCSIEVNKNFLEFVTTEAVKQSK